MLKDTSEVSNLQVLVLAQRVEAQRSQKVLLENIRDAKDFDLIKGDRQRPGQNRNRAERESVKEKKIIENCKYCGMTHPEKQCSEYGKMCSGHGNIN